MDIHFFAKTDVGRVRSANEDFFLSEKITDSEFLFIVADGMGGHQAGDVASKLASETFFDAYRGLRKKNVSIHSAMEQAVRKANSVVFKRASSDIEKRGMGTTFSSVVIAGMKAFIAHVGDSRVYLLRKNRIKRLTTDHSFVEKLVEEGRISADEARDHPQKNVLYMSLGARESFTPEMQNDIALEDGDALLICSDGLSNMVEDETLMHLALGDYPEEAAEALVRLANAHGGTDNITVQVIRVGSLEMMEKTKPIRLNRPRRKLITLLAALLLLALLAALGYVLLPPRAGGVDAESEGAVPESRIVMKTAPAISEIDSARFNGRGVAASDCRFLSGRRLHVVQGGRLFIFDLAGTGMLSIELGRDEQVVPSPHSEIYLLRREPTEVLGYQLGRQGSKRPLLRIQHDGQVTSKESKTGSVPLYRIAGLEGPLIPDYVDESVFVFHDQRHYFAIMNWRTPESLPARIDELAASPDSRLFFKRVGGRMTMLYNDPASGRTALFRLQGVVQKERELSGLPRQPLLLLEYMDGQVLVCYAAEQCLEWNSGRLEAAHRYSFNNFQLRMVRVLMDLVDGDKVAVNDGNKFFFLRCES